MIVQSSAAAEQVLGYLPEELVGKTTECLYPTREMYEDLGWRIRSALDQEGALHTEGHMKRKDGKEIFSEAGKHFDPQVVQEFLKVCSS